MAKKLKIEKSRKAVKWNMSGKEQAITDLLSATHIELFGNGRISIDGCLGVEEYRDTYMKLKLCKGMLIIYGSGFDIVVFENKLITVRGKISSLEFCV